MSLISRGISYLCNRNRMPSKNCFVVWSGSSKHESWMVMGLPTYVGYVSASCPSRAKLTYLMIFAWSSRSRWALENEATISHRVPGSHKKMRCAPQHGNDVEKDVKKD